MSQSCPKIAAVQDYIAAFDAGDAARIAALFAEDASVEDPVGSPKHYGRDAIQQFYQGAVATGAKLELLGDVRTAGIYAAFAFAVHLEWGGAKKRIDVIDVFQFDDAGKITEMRAFWGPANMHEV